MWRKGWYEEKLAKEKIIRQYGRENVIKCAIGQLFDYIVLHPNADRILKVVEVKRNPKGKKEQIEKIKEWCKGHKVRFEYWKKKPNKPFEVEVYV